MLHVNCQGCKNHCCGQIPGIQPILLREEEAKFKDNSETINGLQLIKKKPSGTCIFLDDTTHQCTIYEERPLECRLYPYMLNFDTTLASVKLDKRHCPSLASLIVDPLTMIKEVKKHQYPKEWVDAYKQIIQ